MGQTITQFPQFTLLPTEIQIEILKQDRQTLRKCLTLSKDLFQLVGKELCIGGINITRQLLQTYLNEHRPRIFGVEMIRDDIFTYAIFTLVYLDTPRGYESCWYGETLGTTTESKVVTGNTIKDTFKKYALGDVGLTTDQILNYLFDGKTDLDFDLLTCYRIVSKLPGCIPYLPIIVETWKHWYIENDLDGELLFSENKNHVFTWYNYLITIYTSVFNLGPEFFNQHGSVEINYTFENGKYLFDKQTLIKINDVKKNVDELRRKVPKLFDLLHLYA